MYVPETARYVIILVLVYVQWIESATIHNEIEENVPVPSYSNCKALTSTSLDCSNLTLKAIPNDIPNTILTLDLSNNQLHLDESTFATCCGNLLELDLSNNGITKISQEIFKYLVNITSLILRNNDISDFDSDTFVNLTKLERLDLSKNPLILQKGFISNSYLTTLNLDECGLSEIPDEAFSGIKQLVNLTLKGNNFDENFDSSAFEDLTSLTKLEMKNISRSSISEMCGKLTGIDAVNFEGYNFSCFIYVTEDNFEDAIVGNDPPIEQPLTIERLTSTTKSPTAAPIVTTTLSTTLSIDKSAHEVIHTNDQANKQPDVIATTEIVDHSVDIDNQTLKYILIAILAITLSGILIGLVCRADMCGLKTKLCRSKKANNNRRGPDDTVEM
ncbi:toll-like receptor 3 isoform X2 [Chironomus tepperi]|uniref:toll-like receptor 3 isoform X2 n=1 Tax=Chironomus tepperi TaxID=113505 RepID=UPI00391EEB75